MNPARGSAYSNRSCRNSGGYTVCVERRQARLPMNLSTSMMGLPLAHPFVAGASPPGSEIDSVRRLEDGGAAAIVLPSMFEEQVTLASEGRIRHKDLNDPRAAASLLHFPSARDYAFTPDEYAEHIARAHRAVAVPIIASLNGTT